MEKTNQRAMGRIAALLLAILLALAAGRFPGLAEGRDPDAIRVGYYENEVFQEGAREGAVKSGYAYEYYRKLSEYTGWRYEYVYGSFADLYRMLEDGEIDLLAGLAWREDRAARIGYPDAPMGSETYNLVRRSADADITAEPDGLSGRRIGVLDSAVLGVLEQYLAARDIEAEVAAYPDYGTLLAAFDAGEVDVLAAEGDGVYDRADAEVLCAFGASDYYLCAALNRPDLLSEMNDAQARLAAEEPHYLIDLRARYYPVTVSGRAFSDAEKAWLAAHDGVRVGYLTHYLPYSDQGEDGQATGLLPDVIARMIERFGVQDRLAVAYQGYESYDAMIAAVNDGSVDFCFPVGGGLYYSEENGIYQSNPVISAVSVLAFRGDYGEETTARFAVNENNRMQYYYVRTHYPDAEIEWVNSIEACLDAVRSGRAGATILNGLRANELLKNRRYAGLQRMQLSQTDDRCFGVKIGEEGLLKLLNRGVDLLGNDYLQNRVYQYAEGLYAYTFADFVKAHTGAIALAGFAVLALVVALLSRDVRRARAQMREREAADRALKAKNRELEESRSALAETDEIIAEAGFGVWHILLRDGEPPRMRGNAKMIELLGLAPDHGLSEAALYDAWYSRIAEEAIPSVQRSVSEMLAGRLSENTYRWRHPTLGDIYVRCGGTARDYGDGLHVLRGYHSNVTEIVREEQTRRKALSDALAAAEHANRAKTTFLNNMSHDIRTPMNAIVGFTTLAASHLDHPDQVRDYLRKISVSSQHLLSLINDVLDMSRIESGKVTIEETEVHLPDVIHDLRTIIHANISAKQQELFIDTQDVRHEDIVSDKLRLNQILLNLLSNAIKYTPTGGTISFRVIEKPSPARDTALFEFRVKDNGIGMSEDFQKTIFEAFTREQTSTVSGIQGTGLGMAITKNIVDMMGGTISVKSQVNVGSEFIVEIPCRISQRRREDVPLPQLQGLRALVADDDTDACLSICSMLREIGMRPDWTNYGREAVIRAREALDHADAFSAYIIDWMMPDMNGIETVRRIRRVIGSDAPIIILTAYDWADIEEEAREAGVTAFCAKPIFMSELREVLAGSARPAAEDVPRPQAVDFTGKRLLLAEDNEMNQLIAVEILRQTGFEVDIANDGEEAVHMMETAPTGHYDIILMDIQMPRMDGYEAARRIRALADPRKANIPIVAVTANAFEEDRKNAMSVGMNGHLAKPYDIPAIMRTLSEILG